jgi:DNA-binding SARP family transcriptional activator
VSSGNNLLVNPDARLWVDAEAFERHWHGGWRLAQAGYKAEAIREYEQAETLYTGDYLEDDLYSDWTLLRREALRDAYAGILTMLATMSLEARDYTGTIIWAQKLLAQDSCHEDAYYLLMSSHMALGQAARAAFWYSLCALTLKRELGVEPSERLRSLQDNLASA